MGEVGQQLRGLSTAKKVLLVALILAAVGIGIALAAIGLSPEAVQ
jgi:hypothetical protein